MTEGAATKRTEVGKTSKDLKKGSPQYRGAVEKSSQWRLRHRCSCHVPSASISLFCCSKPPFSPDLFTHTIAALWPYPQAHTSSSTFHSILCSSLTPALPPAPPNPTFNPVPLRFVVDISAVTLNLSSTPDLDARLTGEPRSSPGCAACSGPAAPVIIHTLTRADSVAWDSVVWSGMTNVPEEIG